MTSSISVRFAQPQGRLGVALHGVHRTAAAQVHQPQGGIVQATSHLHSFIRLQCEGDFPMKKMVIDDDLPIQNGS